MLKNPSIAAWFGDWTVKDGQGVWHCAHFNTDEPKFFLSNLYQTNVI